MRQALKAVYRFCGSLKLAVTVIVSLSLTLAAGTFYESVYGTKAVQTAVYQTLWFHLILVFLGINIFCSAAQRYPWKRHQMGFIVAHTGILTVLFGSLLTMQFGVDGSLPLGTGETSNILSIDEPQLEVWDQLTSSWVLRRRLDPLAIAGSLPFNLELPIVLPGTSSGLQLQITAVLPKANPVSEFVESGNPSDSPALLLVISSKATGMNTEQWLKANDPNLGHMTMGLAQVSFAFGDRARSPKGSPHGFHKGPHKGPHKEAHIAPHGGPHGSNENPNSLRFLATPQGQLFYNLSSRLQGESSAEIPLASLMAQTVSGSSKDATSKNATQDTATGWRDFQFHIARFIPHAQQISRYEPAPADSAGGMSTDIPPALQLRVGPQGATRWVGYGETAELTTDAHRGRNLVVRFGPRLVALPFGLKLNHFEMTRYPGTDRPMTYTSKVTLHDGPSRKDEIITMNEPLTYQGFTFYQASFQENGGDPISVFSVGRDPGRSAKYAGSILLVLGIIIMYTQKWVLPRLGFK